MSRLPVFTALHQIDSLLRRGLPLLSCLLLLLVGMALPRLAPGIADIPPQLTVMSVYFWAAHRPELLPLPLVFLLGLLADALTRLPFGMSALSLILVVRLVQNLRPLLAERSYLSLWFGFAVALAATQFLQWAALSALAGQVLPPLPPLFQGLISLAGFPLLAWLLAWLNRALTQ